MPFTSFNASFTSSTPSTTLMSLEPELIVTLVPNKEKAIVDPASKPDEPGNAELDWSSQTGDNELS